MKVFLTGATGFIGSHLALHLVLDQFAISTGIKVSWVRFFYQFGPHEHPNRLVSSVILSLLRGEIAKVTTGEQIRDFLHVENVARAMLAVADNDLSGPVNIGSGRPVSTREVVERIGILAERSHLMGLGKLPSNPSDPKFICADNRKLREGTGWQPKFDLETGPRNTIDWWRHHTL